VLCSISWLQKFCRLVVRCVYDQRLFRGMVQLA